MSFRLFQVAIGWLIEWVIADCSLHKAFLDFFRPSANREFLHFDGILISNSTQGSSNGMRVNIDSYNRINPNRESMHNCLVKQKDYSTRNSRECSCEYDLKFSIIFWCDEFYTVECFQKLSRTSLSIFSISGASLIEFKHVTDGKNARELRKQYQPWLEFLQNSCQILYVSG